MRLKDVKQNIDNYFNNSSSEEVVKQFKDIGYEFECTHPSHNPPNHIYIPQDKEYEHTCPACKEKTTLTPPQIRF